MAGGTEVLREYLVSLGFRVDQTSARRFDGAIGKVGANVGALATRAVAAGVAVQAMVALWSRSMEKLYYSSQRIGDTAGNIKAMEFGARQIGLSGDTMRGALEGMARAMRSNPGLAGVLKSFGVKVEGSTPTTQMLDLVKQLSRFPPYVAQQFAAMFGMDADTYYQMSLNREEMEKAVEARKQMAADAWLDMDQAAAAGKEYSKALGEISERAGMLKDTLMIALVGPMRELASVTNEVLKDWTKIIREWPGVQQFGKKLIEGVTGKPMGDRVELSAGAKARLAGAGTTPGGTSAAAPGGANASNAAPSGREAKLARLAQLENLFGLPEGVLGRIWFKESREGKNMLSPAGAQGHFGLMPGTAKELGVADPNDFEQAAAGAAKYIAQLLAHYGGDLRKAAGAYNWGLGNVDRKGLARAPYETQDYMNYVGGQGSTVTQTNTFNITSPSPADAARQVAGAMKGANAAITRNQRGAVE